VDVTAARVVVCAGVWTDEILGGVPSGYKVRMSKGVHIILPREAIDAETGMILRTERSVLFFIPWDDRWIVGTTDTDWSGDPASVTADESDVSYILEHANRVLAKPLTRSDVLAVYAGLRPLVDTSSGSATTKLSREHVVDKPVPGLVSIAGGKFTTYRIMARDVTESVTGKLPLLGADGLPGVRASVPRLAEDHGVPEEYVEHLLGRYGAMTPEVLGLIDSDHSLRQPLADGSPYRRAEVAYAVLFEGALHVEDVLARRTRLLIESEDAGVTAAPAVAAVMGGLLGWGRRRRAAEVREYTELAASDNAALYGPELVLTDGDAADVPA
jgi:glycerol-3-phosphate dehydrogenase